MWMGAAFDETDVGDAGRAEDYGLCVYCGPCRLESRWLSGLKEGRRNGTGGYELDGDGDGE